MIVEGHQGYGPDAAERLSGLGVGNVGDLRDGVSATRETPRVDRRTEPAKRGSRGKRPILDRSGRDETDRLTREDTTPKPEFVQPAFFSRSEILRLRMQTLARKAVLEARNTDEAGRRAMLHAASRSWDGYGDLTDEVTAGKPTRRTFSHAQDQLPID